MTKQDFKTNARRILNPVVSVLDALKVPPFLVSVFGLAFSLYGAVVVAGGSLFQGAVFLLLSGLCDVIDGDLARRRNLVSRFGAFIDSSFDRVTEFAYFGGILLLTVNRTGFHDWQVVVILVALSGSVLTSYARARAEGLGIGCTVGVMERPERIALLLLGLLLGYRILIAVMTILAVTTMYTFIQRIVHVHRSAGGEQAGDATGESSSAGPYQAPGDSPSAAEKPR
jgi:CDP-diacylglycerol--glycerol-3-phosphate 3-phosphatidyltransferase